MKRRKNKNKVLNLTTILAASEGDIPVCYNS